MKHKEIPLDRLRDEIARFLGLGAAGDAGDLRVEGEVREEGFARKLVSYRNSDGEVIRAFFLEPESPRGSAAIVALHQHNSEWSLGKSEVAGLAGDPLQAFAPVLARAGVPVLAPDLLGFESRCAVPGHGRVLAPAIHRPFGSAEGWVQYYNHAMHRLVRGELVMRTNLTDVGTASSALRRLCGRERIGVVGHSHGGNVALFAAALDESIDFACTSGSACSYRHKLAHGTGLEMALVIPGFSKHYDFDDLIACVAPRNLLLVSSHDDPLAADASDLIARASGAYEAAEVRDRLHHLRTGTGHALDEERVKAIVTWLLERSD